MVTAIVKRPVKIKGQVPDTLYKFFKKLAQNRGMKLSFFLTELIAKLTFNKTDRSDSASLDPSLMRWAERTKDASPCRVHFYADENLAEAWEVFKIANQTTSHSVMIRAVLRFYFKESARSKSSQKQMEFFSE